MRELPSPIASVDVPTSFSPSQLAGGGSCVLRAVLGSSPGINVRMGSHPAAELGRVFHRLLELAARGQLPRQGSIAEDVIQCLAELLSEARHNLSQDPSTAAYADLPRTVSPLVWHQKTSVVTGIAARLLEVSSRRATIGNAKASSSLSFHHLPETGEWSEVRIQAPRLRLAGRIDLVEMRPGTVVIRDLKSGRVEDHDGQILPDINLQLRLYGIMALEWEPTRAIRLVVDTGVEHEVAFDAHIAQTTADWLADLLSGAPPQDRVPAIHLASPGDPCRYCPFRHVCEAYLEFAPQCWRDGSDHHLALDTWGDVEAVVPHPGGLTDITLRDDAGRRVKVFGLRSDRVQNAAVGDRLCFFGLRGRPRCDHNGAWRHPLNFFEVSEDDPRNRAWSLEVFTARSD